MAAFEVTPESLKKEAGEFGELLPPHQSHLVRPQISPVCRGSDVASIRVLDLKGKQRELE